MRRPSDQAPPRVARLIRAAANGDVVTVQRLLSELRARDEDWTLDVLARYLRRRRPRAATSAAEPVAKRPDEVEAPEALESPRHREQDDPDGDAGAGDQRDE